MSHSRNRDLYNRLFRGGRNDRTIQEQHAELLRGGATWPGPSMVINKGLEDELEICCYKMSRFRTAITYLFFFLTLGALRLIFHWMPHWYLLATCVKCHVGQAEKILIKEIFGGNHVIYHVKPLTVLTPEKVQKLRSASSKQNNVMDRDLPQQQSTEGATLSVHFEGGRFRSVESLLMFTCKKVTYIWDPERVEFVKLHGLDQDVPCSVFHDSGALSPADHFTRLLVYGPNKITINELSIGALLFLEVLNPFYIFQIASFILWSLDNYYFYCGAIALMSIFGISMTVRQTRKNQHNLKSTVHTSDVCNVLRRSTKLADETMVNYVTETISTEFLVPGDLLVIPAHGCIMHCDAVLLAGNCILNESMLTGESVPVTKTALPNLSRLIYDPTEHAKHTLFSGTHVIQTRYFGEEKVVAVVVRTGFTTAKGSLVRSILYPPPVDFRFEKDSYKFIILLAAVAFIGFIYTIITKAMRGVAASDLIVEALDLITIVVPPALPAAMTVGRFYAQIRLKKQQIFCISPRTINVSGSIDCVCFDKTGTLTEDGLDLLCVVPAPKGSFGEPVRQVPSVGYDTFFHGLVSCHSLTIIDKQITGDPLDLKMFESTGWLMEEYDVADSAKFDMMFPTVLKPPKSDDSYNDVQIGIIREFPFSSGLQRMGVIVRKLSGKHFEYYSKGSPEMILNYVDKSTIPKDFPTILESYTQEGYRVIAMAHKELKLSYAKINKVQREDIEHDMTFLGLIVLENRLKEDTAPCIQSLNEAQIRVIMVTGDNILTALSVARDCHIVTQGQSVITVNADGQMPPQMYYTYTNTAKVKTGGTNDLSVVNSASVVSLETIESQIMMSDGSVMRTPHFSPPLPNNYRFAITGKIWAIVREHYPELLPKLVTRGVVYARMSPEQKQQLVQELQGLGYVVAMCGDGANDCGALKAAHTGISLSEAESSVASPFTSRNPNIRCVLQVIKEGRAALVTSFGIFKYMAAYSLCQFVSVLILYSIESNLTDMEFLYIDLFIISIFAFFFGKTAAYSGKLVKETPLSSLMSLSPILSLVLQLALLIGMQVAAFQHLKSESWYQPFDAERTAHKDDVSCMENFTVFTISSFQYIILAVVFSKGKPYRESLYSNWGFLLSAILITTFSVYLALWPSEFLQGAFALVPPPDFNFRLYLLGYALINFILALFIELVVIDYLVFKKLRFKFHNLDKSKRKYLAIERDLNRDRKWPTLSDDFKTAASPENPLALCMAEIVIESEMKPNRNNKIINKLLEEQSSPSSETYKSFSSDSQYNIADLPYEYEGSSFNNCPIKTDTIGNGLELNCLENS